MSDDNRTGAEAIAQTGEAEWFPPAEDDAEARLKQQAPRDLRWVVYGADGLRAGWSLLLFVGLTWSFVLLSRPLLRHLLPAHARGKEIPLASVLVGDGFSFAVLALAAFLVSLAERRRFAAYGLGRLRVGQFALGRVVGAGRLSLLVLALHLSGLLVFDGKLLAGAEAWKWGAGWFAGFVAVAFAEEFTTRGFVQFTLARGLAGMAGALGMGERPRRVLGFWITALFFSFLFGFGHRSNAGESPIGLVSAGLIGLVFAFSLWRTGSLWWAIGFHAAWDWAQSFVFGVADSGNMMQQHLLVSHPQGTPLMSGGLTGPEGSVYVLVAVALSALAIAVTLPSQAGSPSDPAYSPNQPAPVLEA